MIRANERNLVVVIVVVVAFCYFYKLRGQDFMHFARL